MLDNQTLHRPRSEPRVAVLMGYYHGQKYILEQLKSIFEQTPEVTIWISDDGDDNKLIPFLEAHNVLPDPRVRVIAGPGKGFATNFMSLVQNMDIQADFYAFADQDDIWFKDKLSRAISWLQKVDQSRPACYCSRTLSIDENGNELGLSTLFRKSPSFSNALVQSIAGANTMVFNNETRNILKDYTKRDIVSHDWWAYILITGVGGTVLYDPEPSLYYRQHGNNIVGSNNSIFAVLKRFGMMLQGRWKTWNQVNLEALNAVSHALTPNNKQILAEYQKSVSSGFFLTRFYLLIKSRVYRQTFTHNVGLYLASILNKL